MTKQKFLDELKEALEDELNIPQQVIDDTLKEYGAMIDDALESGQSVETFSQRMGSPEKVAQAIAKGFPERTHRSNRIVALMPFLATIAFFLIGVFWNAWHPAWLVFLLIPVSAILTSSKISWKGLLVFIILSVFILGGTYFDLWTPLWSLFFLLLAIPNQRKKTNHLRPFALGYSLLAIGLYHIWILFPFDNLSMQLVNLLNIGLPLVLFIPVVLLGFFNGAIQIQADVRWQGQHRVKIIRDLSVVIGIIILYLILGFTLERFWHPGWLIFFLIPVYFISLHAKRFPIVGLMPFIATALFVLVGEFVSFQNSLSGYTLSWLFFLLIPISSILFKGGDSK